MKRKNIFIISIALLMIAGGGSIFLLSRSSNDGSSATTSNTEKNTKASGNNYVGSPSPSVLIDSFLKTYQKNKYVIISQYTNKYLFDEYFDYSNYSEVKNLFSDSSYYKSNYYVLYNQYVKDFSYKYTLKKKTSRSLRYQIIISGNSRDSINKTLASFGDNDSYGIMYKKLKNANIVKEKKTLSLYLTKAGEEWVIDANNTKNLPFLAYLSCNESYAFYQSRVYSSSDGQYYTHNEQPSVTTEKVSIKAYALPSGSSKKTNATGLAKITNNSSKTIAKVVIMLKSRGKTEGYVFAASSIKPGETVSSAANVSAGTTINALKSAKIYSISYITQDAKTKKDIHIECNLIQHYCNDYY